MRPAGIVYQWTQTPVSGFIGRRFKVLRQKKINAFQVNFSEFSNKEKSLHNHVTQYIKMGLSS